ncbi:hypothetical protein [Thermogemmatispora sp.]|uniref:hypothetical protein n=1 Tax=Thermogemmatispora sp. TaxID=1968838 RepID=UPI0035E45F4F
MASRPRQGREHSKPLWNWLAGLALAGQPADPLLFYFSSSSSSFPSPPHPPHSLFFSPIDLRCCKLLLLLLLL